MLRSQLQVLLVALSSSVLLVRTSSTPHRDTLTDRLRPDGIQGDEVSHRSVGPEGTDRLRPDGPQGDEDLTRLLLLKFMAQLASVGENEVLADIDDESGVRDEEMRRQLPISHRERKAGCRNFFWKTFTSC